MSELFYRTEDIKPEEVLTYYVETTEDKAIIDALKGRNPILLVGSRGVGKSFLLRVAEAELLQERHSTGVLPVYVTFTRAALLHTSDPDQFYHWMLARLANRIIRALQIHGYLVRIPASTCILTGGTAPTQDFSSTRIGQIISDFENSWQSPGSEVDLTGLPSLDDFKDVIEDICRELGIQRLAIFFDEAAHIFRPEQQRQFFTIFRDLRTPYVTCNAAVYPGVTSYGDTFQPIHDASVMPLARNVLSSDYVQKMREMVEKQAAAELITNIATNGQNFAVLAYAASGNPRLLLKTISRAPKVSGRQVIDVIRDYYRTELWSEHSGLVDRYGGHRIFIDWGRQFIEKTVLPALRSKNKQYLSRDKKTTCYFWVHRDAPQAVNEALRLLAYTGIVNLDAQGIIGTRAEIGTRFSVNLGVLFALEANPTNVGFDVAKSLTPKLMSKYGANYPAYRPLVDAVPTFTEPNMLEVLNRQMARSVNVLDITERQKEKLHSLNIKTVGDVIKATENKLQEAKYIGEKRSRRMRNAAIAAVFEYLSG